MTARWPQSFTPDEISMVLSCFANHQAVCCDGSGLVNRRTITSDPAKQEALAEYAYERWGCQGSMAYDPLNRDADALWNHWFERVLESVS